MTDSIAKENEVLNALKKAGENMTPSQIRKQEISFVMGTLDSRSTITREFVEKKLDKLHGAYPEA